MWTTANRWVRIAQVCEVTGNLPNSGGVLDQLEMHVAYLEQVYRARTAWQEEDMKRKEAESKARERQSHLG